MLKFRVVVHGTHFQVAVAKKRIFKREEYSSKPAGFYTTRFVEAGTANDAIATVLNTLRDELEQEGRTTEDSIMEVDEIREDETGFDLYAPGGGYTFYSEESELDKR